MLFAMIHNLILPKIIFLTYMEFFVSDWISPKKYEVTD